MSAALRDPSVPVARTLAEASLGEIVNVNAITGFVTAPGWRTRIGFAVFPVLGIGMILAAPIAAWANGPDLFDQVAIGGVLGFLGLVILAVGLVMLWSLRTSFAAAGLANAGRLDEAEALLRGGSRLVLAVSEDWLAQIASLRGDDARALAHAERVVAISIGFGGPQIVSTGFLVDYLRHGASAIRPTRSEYQMPYLHATYTAARALCNMGRVDQARRVLAMAGDPPGDYFPLLAATTSLYCDFCSGACALPEIRLRELAALGRRMRGSWGLLALCGWAFGARGDAAERARLVDEERARGRFADLERLMPHLWRWIHAPAA